MLIEENKLRHWIDNFYGYGSWRAKFWFIDHEEGGGELPEEVASRINYFYSTHGGASSHLCDIRDLYKHVPLTLNGPKSHSYNTLHDYRFDNNAVQHGLWKNLIAFVHGYRNEKLPD